ncbi:MULTISPECIES: FG-GAP repeat domain-containing protein [unclassified Streptomyces]|uniref:FG-GAP repeat domain-containing protein n=1 Tax=unclassified Streptomyces TaxID=2593676 RepID=UPI0036F7D303
MTPTHPARRRGLGAAVATALSVTLGAGALAGAPAAGAVTAAPASGFAAEDATDEPAAIPADHWVLGGGKEGFYSIDGGADGDQDSTFGRLTWTRYADGTKKEYDLVGATSRPMVSGDVGAVVRSGEKTVVLVDAAEGTSTTLELDGTTHNEVNPLKIAGKGLLARTEGGTITYYTAAGGARKVTGIPGTDLFPAVEDATDSHAVIRTRNADGQKVWSLVDLAAAKVVRTYPAPFDRQNFTLSETRMAWVEHPTLDTAKVVVRELATGRTVSVPLDTGWKSQDLQVALAGDWLLTGRPGGIRTDAPSEFHALTARQVSSDGTVGPAVRLLDHFEDARDFETYNPMGLVVRGGSVAAGAGGEGVYRIAPGADGVPRAVLEATTGSPTGVRPDSTVLPHQGETVRPDAVPGAVPTRFAFTLNRCNVKVDAVIRDSYGKALRETWNATTRTDSDNPCSGQEATYDWSHFLGTGDGRYTGASTGSYAASFTFTPMNGIGTATTVSGTFKVERVIGQHDFDRNALPDLFARDASGVLWTDSVAGAHMQLNAPTRRIGGGWQVYDRIESAGGQKLVARDKSGVLWYYPGDGKGGTGARRSIGGGWQVYDKLAGGSDLNGDGKADLLAADKAGVLWYYKGTGNSTTPFTGKTRIGGGWGKYDLLTATGDLAYGSGDDLLARDRDGVLWLYLGNGDGNFKAPVRIGGGWQAYTELIAAGDADDQGHGDLFAYDAREKKFYFYTGTGRVAPFAGRRETTVFAGNAYDHVA